MLSDPPAPPAHHEAVETAVFTDNGLVAVLFDSRSGAVHRLNASASAVWVLVDGTLGRAEMAALLGDLSNVSLRDATRAVADALAQFMQLDLLASDEPTPTT